MKTKTIDIRGMKFVIGWLMSLQVEEMMEEDIEPNDRKRWRERAWRTVVQGLQNGEPKGDWTEQKIRAELDAKFPGGEVGKVFNELHIAILDFSGLKVESKGELRAAPDSISMPSAAA